MAPKRSRYETVYARRWWAGGPKLKDPYSQIKAPATRARSPPAKRIQKTRRPSDLAYRGREPGSGQKKGGHESGVDRGVRPAGVHGRGGEERDDDDPEGESRRQSGPEGAEPPGRFHLGGLHHFPLGASTTRTHDKQPSRQRLRSASLRGVGKDGYPPEAGGASGADSVSFGDRQSPRTVRGAWKRQGFPHASSGGSEPTDIVRG